MIIVPCFYEVKKPVRVEIYLKSVTKMEVYRFNLGQRVGDKFIKLSKIGFSMDCFTAHFLRLFTERRQNLALEWTACHQI